MKGEWRVETISKNKRHNPCAAGDEWRIESEPAALLMLVY